VSIVQIYANELANNASDIDFYIKFSSP